MALPTKINNQYGFANIEFNGGQGSGNWGHAGRPGMVGGSAPSGGQLSAAGRMMKGISDRARKTGGFTMGTNTEFRDLGQSTGYAVGGYGTERSISLEDWDNSAKRKKFIKDFLEENASVFYNDPTKCHLGGWVDDGRVYLDVSKVFTNRKTAAIEAMKTDQDSITDFKQKPGSGKEWPTTKDLVKEYGLEKEYKKYKGIRAKERAADQKKKDESQVS